MPALWSAPGSTKAALIAKQVFFALFQSFCGLVRRPLQLKSNALDRRLWNLGSMELCFWAPKSSLGVLERKCGHVYLIHLVKGESKRLSVHMPTGTWPQVTGTGNHEPSGCMLFVERQFASVFLIHHILTTGMWENVNLQPELCPKFKTHMSNCLETSLPRCMKNVSNFTRWNEPLILPLTWGTPIFQLFRSFLALFFFLTLHIWSRVNPAGPKARAWPLFTIPLPPFCPRSPSFLFCIIIMACWQVSLLSPSP